MQPSKPLSNATAKGHSSLTVEYRPKVTPTTSASCNNAKGGKQTDACVQTREDRSSLGVSRRGDDGPTDQVSASLRHHKSPCETISSDDLVSSVEGVVDENWVENADEYVQMPIAMKEAGTIIPDRCIVRRENK